MQRSPLSRFDLDPRRASSTFARVAVLSAAAATFSGPASGQTIPREFIYAGDQLLAYQANFADVLPGTPFYAFINEMVARGIDSGCGGLNFCPADAVTRNHVARMVLRAKHGGNYAPPACGTPMFGDVPAANEFCPFIEELVRRGVISGCGGGNYCPGNPVRRDQVAIYLLLTAFPTVTPPACSPPNLFTDVNENNPFCKWIEDLVLRGIATGCGGTLYCPTASVSRGQMAVFLKQTFYP